MVYFEITKRNLRFFKYLIPVDLHEKIWKLKTVYAIGAAENGQPPVGAVVFSYEGTEPAEKDAAEEPRLRLLWFYVEPNSRGAGIGTELFKHLIRSAERFQRVRMVADIPQGGKREGLILFLETLGFLVTERLHYEIDLQLSDINDKKMLKGRKDLPNIYSVSERKEEFEQYLTTLPEERRRRITDLLPLMDMDISVIGFDKGTPVGTFVMIKHAPCSLEGIHLDVNRLKMGMMLLRSACYMAEGKYEGTTRVHVDVDRPVTRRLVAGLFPDMHPRLYWHARTECLITKER